MSLRFKMHDDKKVFILNDAGEQIGHIFTPSGSGQDSENAIQVCGFSEAYDLWGCGIFKGYKDIQLLFDNKIMKGKDSFRLQDGCMRCFRKPCRCEVKSKTKFKLTNESKSKAKLMNEYITLTIDNPSGSPFTIKRESDLKKRIIKTRVV